MHFYATLHKEVALPEGMPGGSKDQTSHSPYCFPHLLLHPSVTADQAYEESDPILREVHARRSRPVETGHCRMREKTNRQYVHYKMHTGEKLRLTACSVGNVTWSEDSSLSPFSAFSVSSSARSGVAMTTVEGEGRERSVIARARELTHQCPRSQTRC